MKVEELSVNKLLFNKPLIYLNTKISLIGSLVSAQYFLTKAALA